MVTIEELFRLRCTCPDCEGESSEIEAISRCHPGAPGRLWVDYLRREIYYVCSECGEEIVRIEFPVLKELEEL